MLDLNIIRQQPELVKEALGKRNDQPERVDGILALDKRRREIIAEVEELRRKRNESSKQIGMWMGSLKKMEAELRRTEGSQAEMLRTQIASLQFNADGAREETRMIGDQIALLDEELGRIEANLREQMLWIPNIPHESVPVGADEHFNVHHEPQGAELPAFSFVAEPHWELGAKLNIIDFERGVRLSGSRFYILKSWGARLQRAVIQFMLDYHVNHHGYTEIYPPFMVRSAMFEGAGQLPKFFDNIYRDAEEDLMWLGTAEIALTNLHRDEILAETELPLKYVAYTPCFRREKMSAGKDVRGIKRGHQFDKVEMYQFTRPEDSWQALEELLEQGLDICRALGFTYRVVELATGDLGFASAKTYDIEIWAAGCQEWLEVSSASNCLDFQARRANVRYRQTDGGKVQFAHTLNASGLALPRVIIGILENNQQADGSILIPEPLQRYMGVDRISK